MNPIWAMVLASLLFATMSVCVKLASSQYGAGEVVFYRGLAGALAIVVLQRLRGGTLRTPVPAMHAMRSASGVVAMCLWFYCLGGLPLATATTLNYMSSVWMALFLVGGAVMMGGRRVSPLLVTAVLLGFAGVALVLRPTLAPSQFTHALAGLLSGVLAALAYLQITAMGRSGEPEDRIVFYFSIGSMLIGGALMLWQGPSPHTPRGVLLLLAIGGLAVAAQLLMTYAYSKGSTLVNAVLQYLGILFASGYGLLLFGETLTLPAVLGMVLIVAAGLMTSRERAAAPEPPDTRGRHPGDA
ncbi:MAG: DMT family transporter [Proteobacteria bacterium]|nr:DMT family transporter [Pseudomonadota bacterium]